MTVLASRLTSLAATTAGGIEVDIDQRAIDEAASIARDRRDSAVRAFHDRYVVASGGPRLERVEIITEFRRAVLLARKLIDVGRHTWTSYGRKTRRPGANDDDIAEVTLVDPLVGRAAGAAQRLKPRRSAIASTCARGFWRAASSSRT